MPIFHYIDEHLSNLDVDKYTQVDFTPFDPVSKRTEAEIEYEGRHFTVVKGAPQVLLEMAELSDNEGVAINSTVDLLAAKGYRTLAEVLTTAMYQRLKPEMSGKEAARFAADVMAGVNEKYDTSLLNREFIHTHESAIVEMIESVDIFAEGWFWKKPYPSLLLFGATFSTRVIGTLIAVYGFLIPPIGWTYALYMWAYAMAWFFINDAVKMVTSRILRKQGKYA